MLFFNFLCLFYLMVLIRSHTISKSIASYDQSDEVIDSINDYSLSTVFNVRHDRICRRDEATRGTELATKIPQSTTKNKKKSKTNVPKKATKQKDKTTLVAKVIETTNSTTLPTDETWKSTMSLFKRIQNKFGRKHKNGTRGSRKKKKSNGQSSTTNSNNRIYIDRDKRYVLHDSDFKRNNDMFSNYKFKSHIFTTRVTPAISDDIKPNKDSKDSIDPLDSIYYDQYMPVDDSNNGGNIDSTNTPIYNSATDKTLELPPGLFDDMNYKGTASVEALLNQIKVHAIDIISKQNPSVTGMIENAVTETTFEAVHTLRDLTTPVTIAFDFRKNVALKGSLDDSVSPVALNENTKNLNTPDTHHDTGYNLEYKVQKEMKHAYMKAKDKLAGSLTKARDQMKSVTWKFMRNTADEFNEIARKIDPNAEIRDYSAHTKKITTQYKQAQYKTKGTSKQTTKTITPTSSTKTVTTSLIQNQATTRQNRATNTVSTESKGKDKNSSTKSRFKFFANPKETLPQFQDDYSMLKLYESVLNKTYDDNTLKLLSIPAPVSRSLSFKDRFKLSKRETETIEDLNLKEHIRNLRDGEGMPDPVNTVYINKNDRDKTTQDTALEVYDDGNLANMSETTIRRFTNPDLSFAGLTSKIHYNEYINGYKHYLNFAKDLTKFNHNYSERILYQAHRHHSVDDIGKFILTRLPPVPEMKSGSSKLSTREKRSFFEDLETEDQDIATKSEESWFKRHLYLFHDSGPKKKFHTQQTVTLKSSEGIPNPKMKDNGKVKGFSKEEEDSVPGEKEGFFMRWKSGLSANRHQSTEKSKILNNDEKDGKFKWPESSDGHGYSEKSNWNMPSIFNNVYESDLKGPSMSTEKLESFSSTESFSRLKPDLDLDFLMTDMNEFTPVEASPETTETTSLTPKEFSSDIGTMTAITSTETAPLSSLTPGVGLNEISSMTAKRNLFAGSSIHDYANEDRKMRNHISVIDSSRNVLNKLLQRSGQVKKNADNVRFSNNEIDDTEQELTNFYDDADEDVGANNLLGVSRFKRYRKNAYVPRNDFKPMRKSTIPTNVFEEAAYNPPLQEKKGKFGCVDLNLVVEPVKVDTTTKKEKKSKFKTFLGKLTAKKKKNKIKVDAAKQRKARRIHFTMLKNFFKPTQRDRYSDPDYISSSTEPDVLKFLRYPDIEKSLTDFMKQMPNLSIVEATYKPRRPQINRFEKLTSLSPGNTPIVLTELMSRNLVPVVNNLSRPITSYSLVSRYVKPQLKSKQYQVSLNNLDEISPFNIRLHTAGITVPSFHVTIRPVTLDELITSLNSNYKTQNMRPTTKGYDAHNIAQEGSTVVFAKSTHQGNPFSRFKYMQAYKNKNLDRETTTTRAYTTQFYRNDNYTARNKLRDIESFQPEDDKKHGSEYFKLSDMNIYDSKHDLDTEDLFRKGLKFHNSPVFVRDSEIPTEFPRYDLGTTPVYRIQPRPYKYYHDYFNDFMNWNRDILDLKSVTMPEVDEALSQAMNVTSIDINKLKQELIDIKNFLSLLSTAKYQHKSTPEPKIKKRITATTNRYTTTASNVKSVDRRSFETPQYHSSKNLNELVKNINNIYYESFHKFSPSTTVDSTIFAYDDISSSTSNDINGNWISSTKVLRRITEPKKLSKIKVNPAPEQYFWTPVPMRSKDFDKFLKDNNLDIIDITTPYTEISKFEEKWEKGEHVKSKLMDFRGENNFDLPKQLEDSKNVDFTSQRAKISTPKKTETNTEATRTKNVPHSVSKIPSTKNKKGEYVYVDELDARTAVNGYNAGTAVHYDYDNNNYDNFDMSELKRTIRPFKRKSTAMPLKNRTKPEKDFTVGANAIDFDITIIDIDDIMNSTEEPEMVSENSLEVPIEPEPETTSSHDSFDINPMLKKMPDQSSSKENTAVELNEVGSKSENKKHKKKLQLKSKNTQIKSMFNQLDTANLEQDLFKMPETKQNKHQKLRKWKKHGQMKANDSTDKSSFHNKLLYDMANFMGTIKSTITPLVEPTQVRFAVQKKPTAKVDEQLSTTKNIEHTDQDKLEFPSKNMSTLILKGTVKPYTLKMAPYSEFTLEEPGEDLFAPRVTSFRTLQGMLPKKLMKPPKRVMYSSHIMKYDVLYDDNFLRTHLHYKEPSLQHTTKLAKLHNYDQMTKESPNSAGKDDELGKDVDEILKQVLGESRKSDRRRRKAMWRKWKTTSVLKVNETKEAKNDSKTDKRRFKFMPLIQKIASHKSKTKSPDTKPTMLIITSGKTTSRPLVTSASSDDRSLHELKKRAHRSDSQVYLKDVLNDAELVKKSSSNEMQLLKPGEITLIWPAKVIHEGDKVILSTTDSGLYVEQPWVVLKPDIKTEENKNDDINNIEPTTKDSIPHSDMQNYRLDASLGNYDKVTTPLSTEDTTESPDTNNWAFHKIEVNGVNDSLNKSFLLYFPTITAMSPTLAETRQYNSAKVARDDYHIKEEKVMTESEINDLFNLSNGSSDVGMNAHTNNLAKPGKELGKMTDCCYESLPGLPNLTIKPVYIAAHAYSMKTIIDKLKDEADKIAAMEDEITGKIKSPESTTDAKQDEVYNIVEKTTPLDINKITAESTTSKVTVTPSHTSAFGKPATKHRNTTAPTVTIKHTTPVTTKSTHRNTITTKPTSTASISKNTDGKVSPKVKSTAKAVTIPTTTKTNTIVKTAANKSKGQKSKLFKRETTDNTVYTARDVAALEVIVDLMKESGEATTAKASGNTQKYPTNLSTNAIQVHIAVPYMLNDRKRSADSAKVRKVFSAKMSVPVDIEYQVRSIEVETARTPYSTLNDNYISPGMYLLVEDTKTSKGFALKPVVRQAKQDHTSISTSSVKTTSSQLARVSLSKDYIQSVNKQLLQLYHNLNAIEQTTKHTVKKRCEDKSYFPAQAQWNRDRRRIKWEKLKKLINHNDRVCNCKCRANHTMCRACAASDAVMTELLFEFENLDKYMTDHCTEIQTYFWMNPTGGRKLRDVIRKIDKNINDYYKRVKGKCQGRTCSTFQTHIDKREFIEPQKLEKEYIGKPLIEDLQYLAQGLKHAKRLNLSCDEKFKQAVDNLVSTTQLCTTEYRYLKRSADSKKVYSLDNINVNIICKQMPSYQMESTTPFNLIDLTSTSFPSIDYTDDEIQRNTPKISLKKIFHKKKRKKSIERHKTKRNTPVQIESPLVSRKGESSLWSEYLKIANDSKENDAYKPIVTLDVLEKTGEKTVTFNPRLKATLVRVVPGVSNDSDPKNEIILQIPERGNRLSFKDDDTIAIDELNTRTKILNNNTIFGDLYREIKNKFTSKVTQNLMRQSNSSSSTKQMLPATDNIETNKGTAFVKLKSSDITIPFSKPTIYPYNFNVTGEAANLTHSTNVDTSELNGTSSAKDSSKKGEPKKKSKTTVKKESWYHKLKSMITPAYDKISKHLPTTQSKITPKLNPHENEQIDKMNVALSADVNSETTTSSFSTLFIIEDVENLVKDKAGLKDNLLENIKQYEKDKIYSELSKLKKRERDSMSEKNELDDILVLDKNKVPSLTTPLTKVTAAEVTDGDHCIHKSIKLLQSDTKDTTKPMSKKVSILQRLMQKIGSSEGQRSTDNVVQQNLVNKTQQHKQRQQQEKQQLKQQEKQQLKQQEKQQLKQQEKQQQKQQEHEQKQQQQHDELQQKQHQLRFEDQSNEASKWCLAQFASTILYQSLSTDSDNVMDRYIPDKVTTPKIEVFMLDDTPMYPDPKYTTDDAFSYNIDPSTEPPGCEDIIVTGTTTTTNANEKHAISKGPLEVKATVNVVPYYRWLNMNKKHTKTANVTTITPTTKPIITTTNPAITTTNQKITVTMEASTREQKSTNSASINSIPSHSTETNATGNLSKDASTSNPKPDEVTINNTDDTSVQNRKTDSPLADAKDSKRKMKYETKNEMNRKESDSKSEWFLRKLLNKELNRKFFSKEACDPRREVCLCDIDATSNHIVEKWKTTPRKDFERYVQNITCFTYKKPPPCFIVEPCKRKLRRRNHQKHHRFNKHFNSLPLDNGLKWDWIRNKRSLLSFDDDNDRSYNYVDDFEEQREFSGNAVIYNKLDKHDDRPEATNNTKTINDHKKGLNKEFDENNDFERLYKGVDNIYRDTRKRSKRTAGDMKELIHEMRNLPPLQPRENEVYAMVGDQTFLNCLIPGLHKKSANPVLWDAERSNMLTTPNVIVNGNVVLLKKVEARNSGNYTCRQDGRTHTVRLTVVTLPQFHVVFIPMYVSKHGCSYDDLRALQLLGPVMTNENWVCSQNESSVQIDAPICMEDEDEGTTHIRATAILTACPHPAVSCSAQCRRDMQAAFALLCASNAPVLRDVKVVISRQVYNKTLEPSVRTNRRMIVTHTLRKKDLQKQAEYHRLDAGMHAGNLDIAVTCPAGYYLIPKQKICAACPADTFSVWGGNTCYVCPGGLGAEPGAARCRLSLRRARRYDWWWYPPCGFALAALCVLCACALCAACAVLAHVTSRSTARAHAAAVSVARADSRWTWSRTAAAKRCSSTSAGPPSPSAVLLARFFRTSVSSSRATDSQGTKFEQWKERNMPPPLPPVDFDVN